jgi:hypothetical protein
MRSGMGKGEKSEVGVERREGVGEEGKKRVREILIRRRKLVGRDGMVIARVVLEGRRCVTVLEYVRRQWKAFNSYY